MATRKPLFMNGTYGWSEEMALTDDVELGGLTINSGGTGIVMNSKKITGLGAATSANDAIAYGQSGASLAGLALTGGLDMNPNAITEVPAADASGKPLVYGQASASLASLNVVPSSVPSTLREMFSTAIPDRTAWVQ